MHAPGWWQRWRRPTVLVSLDLETTSADPRSAQILSIGAVPVGAGRVMLSQRFTALVAGSTPSELGARTRHRLTETELRGGRPLAEVLPALLQWLDGRPLLGYWIDFDVQVLERALRQHDLPPLRPRRFELSTRYARRHRQRRPDDMPDLSLEAMLEALDVPVFGRHSALGDAVSVALAWLALERGR